MAAAESYPDDLKYHREHDWARIDGDEAVLGITWFAQDALGEIVYAELPEVGAEVKAVSDVYSPLTGEVVEVNDALQDEPQRVNEDCYGEGWMVKVEVADGSEIDGLMTAAQYREFVAQEKA